MRPFLHTQTHTSVHAHTNMHKTLIFTNITHIPHVITYTPHVIILYCLHHWKNLSMKTRSLKARSRAAQCTGEDYKSCAYTLIGHCQHFHPQWHTNVKSSVWHMQTLPKACQRSAGTERGQPQGGWNTNSLETVFMVSIHTSCSPGGGGHL